MSYWSCDYVRLVLWAVSWTASICDFHRGHRAPDVPAGSCAFVEGTSEESLQAIRGGLSDLSDDVLAPIACGDYLLLLFDADLAVQLLDGQYTVFLPMHA